MTTQLLLDRQWHIPALTQRLAAVFDSMPPRQLLVIYRTTASQGRAARPPYFSQVLCAQSLRQALDASQVDPLVLVINDGRTMSQGVDSLTPDIVIRTGGFGNSATWRLSAIVGRTFVKRHPEGWIYFAEDDYLYTRRAFESLSLGSASAVADYLTLYDEDPTGHEVPSASWSPAPSTCFTFMASPRSLRRDFLIMMLAGLGKTPSDFGMWAALNGTLVDLAILPLLRLLPYDVRLRLLRARHAAIQGRSRLKVLTGGGAIHVDAREPAAASIRWAKVAAVCAAEDSN